MFVLMAVRGESGPFPPSLYAPEQEVICECDHDEYDCADFRSRQDAQECFDYCRWWTQSDDDVHHLDADGDGVACEPTPGPGDEYAVLRATDDGGEYTHQTLGQDQQAKTDSV